MMNQNFQQNFQNFAQPFQNWSSYASFGPVLELQAIANRMASKITQEVLDSASSNAAAMVKCAQNTANQKDLPSAAKSILECQNVLAEKSIANCQNCANAVVEAMGNAQKWLKQNAEQTLNEANNMQQQATAARK